MVSCYEAGYDGFWLHRRLEAAGIENLVIDPASLSVDRRARRTKTDRIDGEKMIRALLAYRRGEPRVMGRRAGADGEQEMRGAAPASASGWSRSSAHVEPDEGAAAHAGPGGRRARPA